jgi:hypothetical protein
MILNGLAGDMDVNTSMMQQLQAQQQEQRLQHYYQQMQYHQQQQQQQVVGLDQPAAWPSAPTDYPNNFPDMRGYGRQLAVWNGKLLQPSSSSSCNSNTTRQESLSNVQPPHNLWSDRANSSVTTQAQQEVLLTGVEAQPIEWVKSKDNYSTQQNILNRSLNVDAIEPTSFPYAMNPREDEKEASNQTIFCSNFHRKKPSKPRRKRKLCTVSGCGKRSRSQGLCIAHGGGKRCSVEGCDKSSQGDNLCIRHGGGKRCSVEGCEKAAQTHQLCKSHGGGPRCQHEGCDKSSQGGGFCRSHGGGKRCLYKGCCKGTQRGDYCGLHGGSRTCEVEGCSRNDRGGGLCAFHGGGKRCSEECCKKPCRRNGLCSSHLRLLSKDNFHYSDASYQQSF